MRPKVTQIPTAQDVAKTNVPAIRVDDSLVKPIESLQKNRVAVLVHSDGKPKSILTTCDLDSLKQRMQSAERAAKAGALFEDKPVLTVRLDTPLEQVARTLSQNRLGTGITVVDDQGRYVGYAFNEDVRQALDAFVKQGEDEVKAKFQQLGADYPELNRLLVP